MQTADNPPLFEIFPWNSNFAVGIELIDSQHQKLVELLNKVICQFVSHDDSVANETVLNELVDYARFHFDQEELLWRKYFGDMALANDHTETHELFFSNIKSILSSSTAGELVTDKLIEYLTNWLAVHILHSDRRMATMVLEINQSGCSIVEAERIAKEKIGQIPVLQSSIIDLYKKLSNSASQLIREKNARLHAESKLQLALKQKAEQELELQAQEYQAHLEFLAYNDPLTGLLNKNGLFRELRKLMSSAISAAESIAVISINLDYFGQISSQLGSEGTNRILGLLAKRWQDALMPNGALAHLGSDDFVVVVKNAKLMDAQLDALYLASAQPFDIDEWHSPIFFTAGTSIYPQDYNNEDLDAEKFHRQADYALFQAKQEMRGSYCQFDVAEIRKRRIKNDQIADIRQGLLENQFKLYYQPKVNMRTGQVIGTEALIRWQHPELGLLAPDAFLPALDNHPFIIDLGEWVIDTAIRQMLTWDESALCIYVSVNIDALQIQSRHFPAILRKILDRYPGFDPCRLDLEILETVAINDIETTISNIQQCKSFGVSFSLDDFGKGYCSLSYLKKLPVDTLKIDQAFVRDMLEDASNISILEGIVAIAKTFNLKVIAEGVESVAHGEFLIQIGCDLAQGYSIARPMPANALKDWLNNWKTYDQWRQINALRRDDIVALTGLAELNKWLKQVEHHDISELSHLTESIFYSKSLELWMRGCLDNRPSTNTQTVHQIEGHYNKLLKLGKGINEQPVSAMSNVVCFEDSKIALEQLTEQIKNGLQECLNGRHTQQNRNRS